MTETSQLTETVTLGEIYWDGYSAADSAYDGRVPYSALGSAVRAAIETGALAVATASRDSDSEPKPATVIVVTEMPFGDGAPVQKRYGANQTDTSPYGQLRLLRKGTEVAVYQSNAWLSVREEGAIVNDGPADKRKLGIALKGLDQIEDHLDDKDRDWADLRIMVNDIHAEIAELDL